MKGYESTKDKLVYTLNYAGFVLLSSAENELFFWLVLIKFLVLPVRRHVGVGLVLLRACLFLGNNWINFLKYYKNSWLSLNSFWKTIKNDILHDWANIFHKVLSYGQTYLDQYSKGIFCPKIFAQIITCLFQIDIRRRGIVSWDVNYNFFQL